ncbi:adenylate-forming enzyme (plasmid) [Pseudomonas amygdali pv. lachrymans str. M301315]|uniref:Adenylate-forming enzyme n=3 Tax=Pseudomonas amygdali TaxID=47877 RepID=A0ABR5KQR9_PSEAV|nr:adenylate-forming enzyme [Pseudomonas amygdali pv. lachrymans str. M301315]KPC17113.1 Adenylate-forming enzyme [Pseudomonas amygdali pv. lachrymans]KPC18072.1 Adenylate-forming enzyme [Pseudomonas amygdali pv. lachrymans]
MGIMSNHNFQAMAPMNTLNILRHYLSFRFSSFRSREALEAWQDKRIRKHLDWVSHSSPFYADFKGLPLSKWPVMNKSTMMANFDQLNTVGVTKEQAFDFAYKSEQERQFGGTLNGITVGLSSGTSGNRGIFLASPAERELWAGAILGKMLPDLLWRGHKVALFLRAGSTLYDSVSSRRLSFKFFDLALEVDQHIATLNAFQPDIIFAPGTMIKMLAGRADLLNFRPKRVIACAEVLYPDAASACEDQLGVYPEQIYQCTEGFLACSQRGAFQFNEDLVHIEPLWLDDEKTRFKPIITDFRRTSQPIIRYELDDVVCVDTASQRVFKEILHIEGRCDDLLKGVGRDGKVETLFPDFLVRQILFQTEVSEFQVQQHPDLSMTVCVSSHEQQPLAALIEAHFSNKGLIVPPIRFADWSPVDRLTKKRRVMQMPVPVVS